MTTGVPRPPTTPTPKAAATGKEVLTLLRQRHARGRTTGVIRIDDIGEGALVVSGLYGGESARPVEAASAALVPFRDGQISRLRQYRTREDAIAAAGVYA
jgi:ketosteroid isomerase-like protein